MTTLKKAAVVLGGYMLAVVAAIMVVIVNDRMSNRVDLQASGGMTAFGDLILFLLALAMFSLPPTIAGVWFLRQHFQRSR